MRTIARGALVAALLLASLAASVLPSAAEPPAPDVAVLKARLWREEAAVLPLPRVEAETGEGSAQAAPELAAVGDWSKIAFQSGRNGDWEIYLADGRAQNAARLTFHVAADVEPRLNRGGTRVVFVSLRDGNRELYVVNADSSGLGRLTATAAAESDPVWSPDGSHILFASDQDGNRELYTIRPDGAGLTRITNDPSYDSMPCWSPDGMQIAWMRRTSETQGVIMVANADGSNVHPITGPLMYLGHPSWSPDGTRIAFDADGNGDGWNDLMMVGADGSNLRLHADPGYGDECWMGSWSPDGEALIVSAVSYVEQGGQLYIRQAAVAWLPSRPGGGVGGMAINTGFDIWPDWQSLDVTPPVAQITPLPFLARAGGFTVSWSGGDVGSAGLKGYEVQYRHVSGGGPWAFWQMTLATSAVFPGEPGNAYAFRIRAWDNAWNTTPWRGEEADTQTAVYTWRLTGTLRDLRGRPAADAAMSLQPPPVYFRVFPTEGRYEAYLQASGPHTFAATKSGAATVPLSLTVTADQEIETLTLRPPDNQIENSDFEHSELAAWQRLGEPLPTRTEQPAQFGGYAALLGAPSRFAPSTYLMDVSLPIMRLDALGTTHVLGRFEMEGGGSLVYAARASGDTDFTAPQTLRTVAEPIHGLDMVPDGEGGIHVAWSQTSSLHYCHKAARAAPCVPEDLSAIAPSPDTVSYLHLVADRAGGVHLFWAYGAGLFDSYRPRSGGWQLPNRVTASGDDFGVSVDRFGTMHLIYGQRQVSNYYESDLYYMSRIQGSVWTAPERVGAVGAWYSGVRVEANAQGEVYALWHGAAGQIVFQSKQLGGAWSAPEELHTYSASPSGEPYLALDTSGMAHLVYSAGEQTPILYYLVRQPGKGWQLSGAQELEGFAAGLVVQEGGLPHLLWLLPGELFKIYHTPLEISSQPSRSGIAQRITLPSDMYEPTVGLKMRGVTAAARDLTVSVTDGNGEQVVASAVPEGGDWQWLWGDLGDWLGQTVTVTVALRQEAGQPPGQVVVDEVLVGSYPRPGLIGHWLPLVVKP